MKKVIKNNLAIILVTILIILTFIGLIITTMPNHTVTDSEVNQFVLKEDFKRVRRILAASDISAEAIDRRGGEMIYDKTVFSDINLRNGLKQYDIRKIDHVGVKLHGTVLHLQMDTNLVAEAIDILITLRKRNSKLGLQQVRTSINIKKQGDYTLVKQSSLISVTKKCPSQWHDYMEEEVQKAIIEDLQVMENLMREYVERR